MSNGVYTTTFCRIVILFVFGWSFLGKVRDISSFINTIRNFSLLPKWFHPVAAIIFMLCELAVVVIMVLGRRMLVFGFLLALLMLMIFCVAILSVLIRRIKTPCNCFGPSKKIVDLTDIVRNLGFGLCAFGGYWLLSTSKGEFGSLSFLGWGVIGIVAMIYISILINLNEIALFLK